jgi:hypothetical protein
MIASTVNKSATPSRLTSDGLKPSDGLTKSPLTIASFKQTLTGLGYEGP